VSARPSRAEIAFACPACGEEAVADRDGSGRCPACGATPALVPSASVREGGAVDRCPACGSEQLYVQRDFNQKAGLAIVIVGAALSPFTPFYSSLIVATLLDSALYLVRPEITICYRCHAHFRGFARNPRHQPFDLHIAEQYGTKGR
jgi:predicted RNA-binding Zn-ribbon protein involved in translation (DUF1610 family)